MYLNYYIFAHPFISEAYNELLHQHTLCIRHPDINPCLNTLILHTRSVNYTKKDYKKVITTLKDLGADILIVIGGLNSRKIKSLANMGYVVRRYYCTGEFRYNTDTTIYCIVKPWIAQYIAGSGTLYADTHYFYKEIPAAQFHHVIQMLCNVLTVAFDDFCEYADTDYNVKLI